MPTDDRKKFLVKRTGQPFRAEDIPTEDLGEAIRKKGGLYITRIPNMTPPGMPPIEGIATDSPEALAGMLELVDRLRYSGQVEGLAEGFKAGREADGDDWVPLTEAEAAALLAEDAPPATPPRQKPARPPRGVLWYLGNREYQVGAKPYRVNPTQDMVLRSFIGRPVQKAEDFRDTCMHVKVEDPGKVLRELCKKVPAFRSVIRLAGTKRGDGYRVKVQIPPSTK
jgi:hypothetical protein